MHARHLLPNVLRLGLAVTAVVAMTYQLAWLHARVAEFSIGNFFSFFTIQSNVLAVLLLASTAIVRREERTLVFDLLRAAATLYMTITGVVFALLLSGQAEKVDTQLGWVNFVVHYLMPLVVVADWLIDPPRHRLPLWVSAAWLGYPAVWFAYTLVRGASVGWYPYPFVDVSSHGYGGVFVRAAFLLVGFLGAAAAFVILGNRRAAARPAGRPAGVSPIL